MFDVTPRPGPSWRAAAAGLVPSASGLDHSSGSVQAGPRYRRVLGRLSGAAPGPCVIVLGGIHGNEPAGIEAALRVRDRLGLVEHRLRGDVLFVAGNRTALEQNRRFVDLDLNRQWTPAKVEALLGRDAGPHEAVEHREQRELIATFRSIVAGARGPLYFIDLHTSSSNGPPFVTIGDTLRNRRFAEHVPLPLILGLEEQVDGALLELLNNNGFVTLGVEAGQHLSPSSPDVHEAVIWLALAAAGSLADPAADVEYWGRQLAGSRTALPAIVEVRFRHAITAGDGFRMEPNFRSFDPVYRGQAVASDRRGPIRTPEGGLLLLPLYQGQGDDGFFIARAVRPFWLRLSALLRRLRLARTMRLLPGVRRHPLMGDVFIVNTRVARFYPLEIFHLLGFRKLRKEGDELTLSRRRYDLDPPAQVSFP
jgi:succinylglutamate desuccinylase